MSYLQKVILENEEILFTTRKHWVVLLGICYKEVLIVLAMAGAFVAAGYATSPWSSYFRYLTVLLALLAILSAVLDVYRWKFEQFVLTNRRVIHAHGIFSKTVLDSSLDKINDVILRQGWIGRLLGFGSIEILTASEQGINLLDRIRDPLGFKRAMLTAKAGVEAQPASSFSPAQPPAVPRSTSDLLQELLDLKNKGVISPAEYDSKRAEILKRM